MSNINTNNLTVNFPVVGKNNSSQGFRDNFAAIKTNIDQAGTELSDLQTKVLLKSPLTDTTLDNNMNGALISNCLTQGFRNSTYSLGSNLSGTVIINLTKADVHIGAIDANTTIILQFAGWAPAGTKSSVDVYFTVFDTNTYINLTGVNLDNSKLYLENFTNNKLSAPVFSGSSHLIAYRFSTLDCGTTITAENITTSQKASQLSTFRTPTITGTKGDQKGSVCFDNNNLYLCVADYDGTSTIWVSLTLSGSTVTSTVTATELLSAGTYIKGAGNKQVSPQLGIPASDLISGLVPVARLGTGTASASTYLRGDNTWATLVGSGSTGAAIDDLGDAIYQAATSSLGLGTGSLVNNTTGTQNTAVGYSSLHTNTIGINNTSIGFDALRGNSTGSNNTAAGHKGLFSNTTGTNNTALGVSSLLSNTTGTNNTAIGLSSLQNNTIGSYNTASGAQSLYSNTGGTNNTGTGYQVLYYSTAGFSNSAFGHQSLYSNVTGYENTSMGFKSLEFNTTGFQNTAIGLQSLRNNTAGTNNTAIGANSLSTTTLGSNNSGVGNGAVGSSPSASNEVTLGNSSITSLRCQVTSITSLSDERDKTNWDYNIAGLSFVRELKPGYFTWNTRDKAKVDIKAAGFSAQQLLQTQIKHNAEHLDLVSTINLDKLEARYSNLLPVLVKAIQDLAEEVDRLKNKYE